MKNPKALFAVLKMSTFSVLSLIVFCLVTTTAFSAECPAGSKTLKSCKSTPGPDNDTYVVDLFSSVAICESGSDFLMSVENAQDKIKESGIASVETRPGSTTYHYLFTPDVTIHLEFTSGTMRPVKTAKLSMDYYGQPTGATIFTCE